MRSQKPILFSDKSFHHFCLARNWWPLGRKVTVYVTSLQYPFLSHDYQVVHTLRRLRLIVSLRKKLIGHAFALGRGEALSFDMQIYQKGICSTTGIPFYIYSKS